MWEQHPLRGFDHDRWNGIRRGYKDGGDYGAHLLIEAGNDNSFTQSLLLLPQTRKQYEQQRFVPGSGSGFEAMVGIMEHAVCSYQPRIEAGHTSSSMQSLVLSIQPRMTMKEIVEWYANLFFPFYYVYHIRV
jgi:hypothetical protein